jgi:ribosomal-protein-alanine N-acetyltransferase
MRVVIRELELRDREEFLLRVRQSRALHAGWVVPPDSNQAYRTYVNRSHQPTQRSFLVCLRDGGELAGVINLNEIVFGFFQSAYLGYYGFSPYSEQGLMSEGLSLVLTRAFRSLRLHRLEANIQPCNRPSIALVRGLGFRKEGVSRRYLKVGGRWRDHERWATIAEDWRPRAYQRDRAGGVRG